VYPDTPIADAGTGRRERPRPTPAHDLAERLRRLRYFSYARVAPGAADPRGPDPALADDLARALGRGSPRDPDLFIATPGDPRAVARPGLVLDSDVWPRATRDGSIRALYAALRPLHAVVVGPARLTELSERLRFASFTLEVVETELDAAERRARLAELVAGHRRFCGAPSVYLFHAGAVGAWWVLELHRRLRNAFLIDLGPALDACLADRVLGDGWGWIHWRAVARHLGLDAGRGPREAAIEPAPLPSEAPGRPRPVRRGPPVERRRAAAAGRAPRPTERLHEGDLERCLDRTLAGGPRDQAPAPASEAPHSRQ